MAENEYEEEDFSGTTVSGRTLLRMLSLTLPHWPWLAGFLGSTALVALIGGAFNFLKKKISDRGIHPNDAEAMGGVLAVYAGLSLIQSGCAFGLIYLAGIVLWQYFSDCFSLGCWLYRNIILQIKWQLGISTRPSEYSGLRGSICVRLSLR